MNDVLLRIAWFALFVFGFRLFMKPGRSTGRRAVDLLFCLVAFVKLVMPW